MVQASNLGAFALKGDLETHFCACLVNGKTPSNFLILEVVALLLSPMHTSGKAVACVKSFLALFFQFNELV